MRKFVKDYINHKFGRLTIVSVEPPKITKKGKKTMVRAICECGNTVIVQFGNLTSGHTISCGCFHTECLTGPNNPSFKHDVVADDKNEKRDTYFFRWARAVKKRDDFTCQICGSKKNVVAHHINSYAGSKEMRYNLENGVTLCRDCHTDFHCNFMGSYRTPCNEDDFQLYLLQV